METSISNCAASSDKSGDVLDKNDPDFFVKAKHAIEKGLSDMKKVVDNISQMRVDAAYLESDLLSIIDAPAWTNISDMMGLTSINILD